MSRSITDEAAFDHAELIRFGTIASVDLAAARCTVLIEESGDDTLVTPPIRWLERQCGATRTWSPPTVNEQVLLLCPYGELAGAVALRGMMSTAFPAVGSSEEELILFADGARIAYDAAAHRLSITLPASSTVDVIATAMTIDGDVTISGDVTVAKTLTATTDVVGGGKSLKGHKHSAVQPGGGQSGPPA